MSDNDNSVEKKDGPNNNMNASMNTVHRNVDIEKKGKVYIDLTKSQSYEKDYRDNQGTTSKHATVTAATKTAFSGNSPKKIQITADTPMPMVIRKYPNKPDSKVKIDAFDVLWNRRLAELRDFHLDNGHSDVPSNYQPNK